MRHRWSKGLKQEVNFSTINIISRVVKEPGSEKEVNHPQEIEERRLVYKNFNKSMLREESESGLELVFQEENNKLSVNTRRMLEEIQRCR